MSSLFKSYRIYLLFIIRKFGKSSSTHFLLAGGSFFLSVMELIFKTGGRRKKCNSKTLVPVSLLYFLRIICHWVLWKNPFLSPVFYRFDLNVHLNSFTVCISTLKKIWITERIYLSQDLIVIHLMVACTSFLKREIRLGLNEDRCLAIVHN